MDTMRSESGVRVADVMVTDPKRLPATATAGRARAVLDDGHVHMVLLVDGDRLAGTVVRDDLEAVADDRPALGVARLAGRTVDPTVPADAALAELQARGQRRLAVVDADGRLLGLLCLKRRRTGFCSDADVADRAAGPRRSGLRTP
ncbi:hypothetical protein GCM10009737_00010 [Nocardioides lentus]|uniref:CBS domain-containing protein n=2 Tax=Nocardioides lentus TaxID=338077 RepID=A0ABP5A4F2_9ACTN